MIIQVHEDNGDEMPPNVLNLTNVMPQEDKIIKHCAGLRLDIHEKFFRVILLRNVNRISRIQLIAYFSQ